MAPSIASVPARHGTNIRAAPLLAKRTDVPVTNLSAISWWNVRAQAGSNEVVVLGLFPVGTHVFSEGVFQTNPPVTLGLTRGGAPSGWVGQGRRVSPARMEYWNGHYTPSPVIYVQVKPLPARQRLAVRLRDERGRYWIAQPEPGGSSTGIHPFLVDLPPDIGMVTAEVVLLQAMEASFDVATRESAAQRPR